VSFAAITLCVVSQRVFIVFLFISSSTQSGNLWIHPRMLFGLTPQRSSDICLNVSIVSTNSNRDRNYFIDRNYKYIRSSSSSLPPSSFYFGNNLLLNTDSMLHLSNLTSVTHRRHICNLLLINNISDVVCKKLRARLQTKIAHSAVH
jgi:hypothetical protein